MQRFHSSRATSSPASTKEDGSATQFKLTGLADSAADRDLRFLSREDLADLFRIAAELICSEPQTTYSDSCAEEKYSTLTQREREVLILLCAHKTPKDISEELRISLDTVRDHVAAILKKLDVGSYREAAALARREMLMD